LFILSSLLFAAHTAVLFQLTFAVAPCFYCSVFTPGYVVPLYPVLLILNHLASLTVGSG